MEYAFHIRWNWFPTAEVYLLVRERGLSACIILTNEIHKLPVPTKKMNANYSRGLLRKHMNNAALINHKIKEIKVSSTTECALYWLWSFLFALINTGVHSYLANHGTTRSSLICQLNNASADSDMENFVNICGLKHYSTISRNWNTNLIVH